jgi:plastocyanin
MDRIGIALALVIGVLAMGAPVVAAPDEVAVLDDCDPNDSGWGPTGGCALEDGDVTVAEFLNTTVQPHGYRAHPAWRNEPSYIKSEPGDTVQVTNEGGRNHTFTEVAGFGNGIVPPLNDPPGSTDGVPAACAAVAATPGGPSAHPTFVAPGESLEVTGLGAGDHLFMCCFHPWMRAEIKVKEDVD